MPGFYINAAFLHSMPDGLVAALHQLCRDAIRAQPGYRTRPVLNRTEEDCLCACTRYPSLLVGRPNILAALESARDWPHGRALTEAEITAARVRETLHQNAPPSKTPIKKPRTDVCASNTAPHVDCHHAHSGRRGKQQSLSAGEAPILGVTRR